MDATRLASPLAYLITFHTYGTWLPGDERGTVARENNRYGEPHRGRCDALLQHSRALLRTPPVALSGEERRLALGAFEEVCRYRPWTLRAAHVRSNHVHLVVKTGAQPSRILGDMKAYATRRIVQAGHRPQGARLWARHGSTRHLWDPKAIAAACFYVLNEQGDILSGTVSSAP